MEMNFRGFIEASQHADIKMQLARAHLERGDVESALDVLTPAPKRKTAADPDDPDSVLHEPTDDKERHSGIIPIKDYLDALEYLKKQRNKNNDPDPGETIDYPLPAELKKQIARVGAPPQPFSASQIPS